MGIIPSVKKTRRRDMTGYIRFTRVLLVIGLFAAAMVFAAVPALAATPTVEQLNPLALRFTPVVITTPQLTATGK
jgi:hypothetical protein